MMHWLNPFALGGLGLLALPIVIHLLRTRQAERIRFPTLRFVAAARTAAVRVRPPADWLLLAIRLAIVTAAVMAVAGPVIVTGSRIREWNDRVARAVVVDASAAMSAPDAAGRIPLEAARQAAAAESNSAIAFTRIETASVREGLVRAAAWLADTPPARREIVVLSSFADGTLRERDVQALPVGVGLRLIRVGELTEVRRLAPVELFGVTGSRPRTIDTELNAEQTRVRFIEGAGDQSGLFVRGADQQSRAVQGLFRTVAAAGAPAPSPDEPLVCVFGGADSGPPAERVGPGTPRWILRTLVRLQSDWELRRAATSAAASFLKPSGEWTVVAVDRTAAPIVQVAAEDGRLLMQIGAAPESFVAAAAVRALLMARAGTAERPNDEIVPTSSETLAAWSRPAGSVGADAWRRAERSDGRWFWVAAALLLVLEQRVRRSKPNHVAQVRNAA